MVMVRPTWLLRIIRHWSKWCRSMVDVVYNWASGEEALSFRNTNYEK